MREKKDPLEVYIKMCQEEPIARSMLGESADVFLCPILQHVPGVPVIAPDGHMYDYESIRKWLKENDVSPMTNEKMSREIKPLLTDSAVMQTASCSPPRSRRIKQTSSAKKRKLSSSKTASAHATSSNV